MIFAIYYTKVGKPFIDAFLKTFPQTEVDIHERFPENVNDEIALCFQSIKRVHPDARCVLLTDLNSPIDLNQDIEVLRDDLNPNEPAYMRLKAQIKFLETTETDEPIIFCDYDILFQHPLNQIFEQAFDLGLVYRKQYLGNQHPAPINGGLLIVNNRQKALHFLKEILAFYLNTFPEHRAWGGFQASLNEMLGPKRVHDTFPNLLRAFDTKILLLPSTDYNYAIAQVPHFLDFKPEKTILHFKGAGKKAMADYWNSYLA